MGGAAVGGDPSYTYGIYTDKVSGRAAKPHRRMISKLT